MRLIDIPIQGGIILNSNGQPAGEFVTRLKSACARYFGNAGSEFVKGLVNRYSSVSDLQSQVGKDLDRVLSTFSSRGLEPAAVRVQKRFALIQVSGEIAVKLGILPFSEDEVADAVRETQKAWVDGLGHLSEAIRGMDALAEFLLRFRGRFQSANFDDESGYVQESFGFFDIKENLFLLTKSAFQEGVKQNDPREVCKELKRRNLIVTNEPGRYTYKKLIPQLKTRPRFYAVRAALLEEDSRELMDERDSGTLLSNTGT